MCTSFSNFIDCTFDYITVNFTVNHPVEYGVKISTFPTVLSNLEGSFVFSAAANPRTEVVGFVAVCGKKNETGDTCNPV